LTILRTRAGKIQNLASIRKGSFTLIRKRSSEGGESGGRGQGKKTLTYKLVEHNWRGGRPEGGAKRGLTGQRILYCREKRPSCIVRIKGKQEGGQENSGIGRAECCDGHDGSRPLVLKKMRRGGKGANT